MPIRESEKQRYPKDWKAISKRIREREGNRCKWCAVENGSIRDGSKIVLTVAHLDHQPENCADDNLAALCQRCHLRYDKDHHQRNARETRIARKDAARLLLQSAPQSTEEMFQAGEGR